MEIGYTYWLKKNVGKARSEVLFQSSRLHISLNLFGYGYRKIGFSARKSIAFPNQVYGSLDFGRGQIFYQVKGN